MKATLDQLIAREISYILVGYDNFPAKTILLAGSFNPLHAGHEALLLAAEKTTGRSGIFELSVINVAMVLLTGA